MFPHRTTPLRKLTLWMMAIIGLSIQPAVAQTPPSASETAGYQGLFAAAARGDAGEIARLVAKGTDVNTRDGHQRTALHVAAHGGHKEAIRALIKGGADPNALDARRYDIVTIAAVRDDEDMVRLAISLGSDPKAITSPYDGTALIAAAHLGHDGVVRALVDAGAPLDHVNNLHWTALIESIVLGDGGPRHTASLKALLDAGASPHLADGQGVSPLSLARSRGYQAMIELLQARIAGGRP
jgi:ankyrin repeat protein